MAEIDLQIMIKNVFKIIILVKIPSFSILFFPREEIERTLLLLLLL